MDGVVGQLCWEDKRDGQWKRIIVSRAIVALVENSRRLKLESRYSSCSIFRTAEDMQLSMFEKFLSCVLQP